MWASCLCEDGNVDVQTSSVILRTPHVCVITADRPTSKVFEHATPPIHCIDRIDEEYKERGYTSRSEAIRDALRSWVDPPVQLTDETLAALATSRKQVERRETYNADEVRERLGLDDE